MRMSIPCLFLLTMALSATEDQYGDEDGRPMLGINMRPPPISIIEREQLGPNQGVYVQRVFDDTAARRMGIRSGDVIISVNERPIDSMSSLREVVSQNQIGDAVSVVVRRNGEDLRMGDNFGQWPDEIPYRELDRRAEDRYRSMLERRMQHRQDHLERLREANERDAERLQAMQDAARNPFNLPEEQIPERPHRDLNPDELTILPTQLLLLPAWRFDMSLAIDGPQETARTRRPAEGQAPMPVSTRFSFSVDGPAY